MEEHSTHHYRRGGVRFPSPRAPHSTHFYRRDVYESSPRNIHLASQEEEIEKPGERKDNPRYFFRKEKKMKWWETIILVIFVVALWCLFYFPVFK